MFKRVSQLAFWVGIIAAPGVALAGPATPSSITATATSSSQINLKWTDKSAIEEGFVVQRSLSSSSGFATVKTLPANSSSFTNSSLASETKYYYRVASFDDVTTDGKTKRVFSPYTPIVSAQTLRPRPAIPASVTAAPVSASQISLMWTDKSAIEDGFIVQRSLSSSTGFATVKTLPANSGTYTDASLKALTKYYYRLAAFDDVTTNGVTTRVLSYYSSTVSAQTLASAPTPVPTATPKPSATPSPSPTATPKPSATPSPSPTATPSPTQPPVEAGTVTNVTVSNTTASVQQNVPVTFGHVFAVGDLPTGTSVTGKLSDGSALPLQVNVKARHADGSVRHAVISAIIPKLTANQNSTIHLVKSAQVGETATSPVGLLGDGFSTRVLVNLGGVSYSASAEELLKTAAYKQWLSGNIANEWLVSTPLKTSQGDAHPHLTARFAVRSYSGLRSAKVDVTLENNWAYEVAPQNFTYDVQIQVGGATVYSKAALMHPTHARWKKTFWWGGDSKGYIRHNTAYVIGTRAVANYDQSIPITESNLANLKTKFSGAATEPISSGLANRAMASTGGRADIGLLPAWAATYLLSMDPRAQAATLGMGDLGGSWSAHYRDKNTDQPVSLYDYPYMTILGNPGDTKNPKTGLREAFPTCGGDCKNPNTVDVSHQPNFAYLPYLMTGDHYYLEELQFYAMYDSFASNPGYRKNIQGLLSPEQLRGQGWGLRTIAEAAYITPDNDRLKPHFMGIVDSNLDWYNSTYTNNPDANKLGIIVNGYSIVYKSKAGTAPWQDDFFTQAVGHTAELGFAKALPLLKWKSTFQIGRMTAPGFCWIMAANYTLTVRANETSPFFATMAEVYQNSFEDPVLKTLACNSTEMAANLGRAIGDMGGYSTSTEGYPSNFQPALAYSVDSGHPDGAKAWQLFINRTLKPNYGNGPQFSIVPRK